MMDDTQMPQETPDPAPTTRRRSPLRRLGCGIILVIWFAVLLFVPCFFIIMVSQGQIVIGTGSAPGQEFRVWLIMEADERGFGLSTPVVRYNGDNNVCVETRVSFLLWTGTAEPLVYCECYERNEADIAWTPIGNPTENCE